MATRQYIGARYVPQFFNGVNGSPEWVSGLAYEALTIVTRLNASYTSRKNVPSYVGAPESNPEYWVITGNYNAQVELYRQEVEEIKDTVDALEQAVKYVTPEMYGAVGDGVTDDTEAIQAMCDDMGYASQAIFTAERYYITDTITVNSSFVSFSGGFGAEWVPNIYTDKAITMFNINSLGFKCYNLSIGGDRYQPSGALNPTIIFNFDHDNATKQGDIDAEFYNCIFGFASKGIYCKGRNVKVSDSTFSHITYIAFHADQTALDLSNRGYEITNCRFHSCTGSAANVCIKNDIANSAIKYFLVQGCYVDLCNRFYEGKIGNAVIQNNYIIMCNDSGMMFDPSGDTGRIDIVSNNTLQGKNDTSVSQHGIDVRANADMVVIKNNSIYNYSLNAINVRAGSKTIITGNVCRHNGLSSGRDITILDTAVGVCNLNNLQQAVNNASSGMTVADNYIYA